jgi:hypothetical protein
LRIWLTAQRIKHLHCLGTIFNTKPAARLDLEKANKNKNSQGHGSRVLREQHCHNKLNELLIYSPEPQEKKEEKQQETNKQ